MLRIARVRDQGDVFHISTNLVPPTVHNFSAIHIDLRSVRQKDWEAGRNVQCLATFEGQEEKTDFFKTCYSEPALRELDDLWTPP